MKTITAIIVLSLCSLLNAQETQPDPTKIPAVSVSLAAAARADEAADAEEAKVIEAARKAAEDRKAANKKRLIASLKSAAVGNKDSKAILAYAESLEGGEKVAKAEPIRMKVNLSVYNHGQFVADIKKDQTVTITATGKWYVDPNTISDANGRKDKKGGSQGEYPAGALLGIFKDGSRDPVKFVVGTKFSQKFNTDGRLELVGNSGNNGSGDISVEITIN